MKAEKIYKVVDVKDELPKEDGRYGVVLSNNTCVDSIWFRVNDSKWDFTGNIRVSFWLKEEPEEQYCFSGEKLEMFWQSARKHVMGEPLYKNLEQYLSSLNIKP